MSNSDLIKRITQRLDEANIQKLAKHKRSVKQEIALQVRTLLNAKVLKTEVVNRLAKARAAKAQKKAKLTNER